MSSLQKSCESKFTYILYPVTTCFKGRRKIKRRKKETGKSSKLSEALPIGGAKQEKRR